MSKPINKIVIVGGGSAGWMTAATLTQRLRNREIILIEDPNTPTVGVGESTLGFINEWLRLLGIKDTDFMKACDATYKMSISFTDFYKKGSGSFHYPFGGIDTTGNAYAKNDWYLKKFMYPDTPVSDYADCVYPIMSLVNAGRITTEPVIPHYNFSRDVAYHFDAAKFGAWLRDRYSMPRGGVKHIQGKVKDIPVNEDGIEKLVLESGEEITADLYIDCTGFRSILLGGAMNEPFNSYHDILPNNSAWAAQVPYNDKKKQLVPYTDGWAIGNGWVWRIPLWHRMGMGYVYSDKYIDDEGALEEFKDHLREHNQLYEDQKFHKIKFKAGIYNRIWVKNVAAIGLSAGFIEPLESNGLYSVHMFLVRLLRAIDRDNDEHLVSEYDRDSYNWSCRVLFDNFSQFVAMHYSMSLRNDTEYWRDVGRRTYCGVNDSLRKGISRNDSFIESFQSKFQFTRLNDDGVNAIATGLHYFPTDMHYIHSMNDIGTNLAEEFEKVTRNLNSKKEIWDFKASKCPTVYDFLKERIYHGEE
jgi:Tryptophan halogenase